MGEALKASRGRIPARSALLVVSLAILLASQALPQAPTAAPDNPAPQPNPAAQPASSTQIAAAAPSEPEPESASIAGTLVSPDGSVYQGVHIVLKLKTTTGPPRQETATTDSDGHFRFSGLSAGPWELTVSSGGFATQTITGTLHPGESYQPPPIVLLFASATSRVEVTASAYDIATEQLHIEEQQRVLGFIPNFYVVYTPNALPLSPRQKFHLAWRSEIDLFTIAASAATAGIEQADNDFSGYGQGAQGYFKRFGANYADSFIGNMLGGAAFPAIFKQDPRYFYLGHGTIRHRALYAIANAIICKGDNGHWQFGYSGIMGSLAAAGISNIYYPASNRDGATLTIENTAIGIGGSAISNLFQEFVVRKLTPHLPNYSSKP